jgi:hypothetical protein
MTAEERSVRTIFADEVRAHDYLSPRQSPRKAHETRKGSHYYTRSPSQARI